MNRYQTEKRTRRKEQINLGHFIIANIVFIICQRTKGKKEQMHKKHELGRHMQKYIN
jgi:hypothetical protein